jgi:hypothetical protein
MRNKNILSIAGVLRLRWKLKHFSIQMMIQFKKGLFRRKEVYVLKKMIKTKIENSAKLSMISSTSIKK